MVLDGNIQVEVEALWDAYNLASETEQVYIMLEIERLYNSAREGGTVKDRVLELVA